LFGSLLEAAALPLIQFTRGHLWRSALIVGIQGLMNQSVAN
jgi:hypothetical protein